MFNRKNAYIILILCFIYLVFQSLADDKINDTSNEFLNFEYENKPTGDGYKYLLGMNADINDNPIDVGEEYYFNFINLNDFKIPDFKFNNKEVNECFNNNIESCFTLESLENIEYWKIDRYETLLTYNNFEIGNYVDVNLIDSSVNRVLIDVSNTYHLHIINLWNEGHYEKAINIMYIDIEQFKKLLLIKGSFTNKVIFEHILDIKYQLLMYLVELKPEFKKELNLLSFEELSFSYQIDQEFRLQTKKINSFETSFIESIFLKRNKTANEAINIKNKCMDPVINAINTFNLEELEILINGYQLCVHKKVHEELELNYILGALINDYLKEFKTLKYALNLAELNCKIIIFNENPKHDSLEKCNNFDQFYEMKTLGFEKIKFVKGPIIYLISFIVLFISALITKICALVLGAKRRTLLLCLIYVATGMILMIDVNIGLNDKNYQLYLYIFIGILKFILSVFIAKKIFGFKYYKAVILNVIVFVFTILTIFGIFYLITKLT